MQVLVRGRSAGRAAELRLQLYQPRTDLGRVIRECFQYLPLELAEELFDHIRRCVVVESALSVIHIHGPQSDTPGRWDHYGVVGRKVVTDAGVGFLRDCFTNTSEAENLKYHGIGTGSTAEAAGNTALVTELTTQYNPDNTRATGSTTTNGANVYRTVGTNTVDSAVTITEHGIFSQAATGGGTLLDRTVWAGNSLNNGDSLTTTYDLTLTSGG